MITLQFKESFPLKFLNRGKGRRGEWVKLGEEKLKKKKKIFLFSSSPSLSFSLLFYLPQVGEEWWWRGGSGPGEEAQGTPGAAPRPRERGVERTARRCGHDQQPQVTRNVLTTVHTYFLVSLPLKIRKSRYLLWPRLARRTSWSLLCGRFFF